MNPAVIAIAVNGWLDYLQRTKSVFECILGKFDLSFVETKKDKMLPGRSICEVAFSASP